MKGPRDGGVDALDLWLRQCIHCGLCLNDCPTYRLTGDEVESPRGRLGLMGQVLREGVQGADLGPLDRCLGCLACQSICPSGVPYGDLLFQARLQAPPPQELGSRFGRWLVDQVLSRPRLLAGGAWLGGAVRGWFPSRPRALHQALFALPQRRPRWPRSPATTVGPVAVLRGCAQWVFEPEVLTATLRLLRATGVEAWVPPDQGCCGALSHHQASARRARELVRQNLRAFEGVETVVIPSAGCSAFFREQASVFAPEDPERSRAHELGARSEDLLVWLWRHRGDLRFRPCRQRVVYQNPCHHQHAQGLRDEGKELLKLVPGLDLVEAAGEGLCCGSAGSYSLTQPELAVRQRQEKLRVLLESHPELILTANPGCEFFLEAGTRIPVTHIACFLADHLVVGA